MTLAPNPRIPAGGPPPYVACVPMQEQPKVYGRYPRIQSIVTGIIQIIIGLLCIIFNVVALRIPAEHSLAFVGHGIWCGILFILTGGFGIGAGKDKLKCQILAYMVLCIISCIYATALVGIASAGAISAIFCDYRGDGCGNQGIHVNMEAGMVFLAIAEIMIASVGLAPFCTCEICCYRPTNPNPTIEITRHNFPNNRQVIYNYQAHVGQHAYLPQLVMDPSGSALPPPPDVSTYEQSDWSNSQRPYAQSDLSNPRRPYAHSNRPSPQRPYAQSDWSNPRRPYTPSDWSSLRRPNTQSDWSSPRPLNTQSDCSTPPPQPQTIGSTSAWCKKSYTVTSV